MGRWRNRNDRFQLRRRCIADGANFRWRAGNTQSGFSCIDFGEGDVADYAGFYPLYPSQGLDQSLDLPGPHSRRARLDGFVDVSTDISPRQPRGVKMMNEEGLEEYRVHEAIWRKIYDAVDVVFSDLQHQGMIGDEEYFVVEDDWGWNVVQTEIVISHLWPQIARRFQSILADFPDWAITMQESIRTNSPVWASIYSWTALKTN